MNPELSSPSFPALPVRRRETLEIFDTALKLYRRYFWVLLGWSALASATLLTLFLAPFFYLLAMPLVYGATSCCVAAAVRGQSVRFRQCWQFTKPRYGALVGVVFVASVVVTAFSFGLQIVSTIIVLLGVAALSNAPESLQVVLGVIAYVLFLVVLGGLGVVAFCWLNMVPIVACLEDDKRGPQALSRAFELLKGNWRRVFGMSLLLGLASVAVTAILGGIYFALVGASVLPNALDTAGDNFLQIASVFGIFFGLFFLLWNPAYTLVLAVLYLDLRVRREALDLEWTAYSTAPPAIFDASTGVVALETRPQTTPETSASSPASFAAGAPPKTLDATPFAPAPPDSQASAFPETPSTTLISAPTTPASGSETPISAPVTLINAPGTQISVSGTPISVPGTQISVSGTPISTTGTPVNAPGTPINAQPFPISAPTTPINTPVTPIDAAPTPPRAVALEPFEISTFAAARAAVPPPAPPTDEPEAPR